MKLMSQDGLDGESIPFIGRHSLFASERLSLSLKPTRVGKPPLAAQLQRYAA
ncbi:hypothetical protein [Roseateles sp.]|uniref:hypothetical protein n=1 Tax=Roseateles sp. TaxID=1971397 RepID=UPI003265E9F8